MSAAQQERYVAAVVQHPPAFLDHDACVERAVELIGVAAGEGAQLVAFSESWLPGYPIWVFAAAGWEDPVAKRLYARLARNSIEVPGPAVDALAKAARRHRVHVVMGATERDARYSRGSLYNSLLFFSDEGTLLGVHRKLMPTHAERMLWTMGDARGLDSYDTPLGRLGGLVCWEHFMPLSRFAMHASGEQVHVAAWPEIPELHQLASRHYAIEGRCYVVCAGQLLRSSDIPADLELPDAIGESLGEMGAGDDVILPGGSGIIGPDGAWIAGPAGQEPTIVLGEIVLSRVLEEQLALDAAGHYNRPDIFSVTVDRRARPPFADVAARTAGTAAEPAGDAPRAAAVTEGDPDGAAPR